VCVGEAFAIIDGLGILTRFPGDRFTVARVLRPPCRPELSQQRIAESRAVVEPARDLDGLTAQRRAVVPPLG
jgi:hypothetical protein